MKANSKQLFKHVFQILSNLQEGTIDAETAKAHTQMVKQGNNLLKYELDRAKAVAKFENLEIRNIEEQ